MLEPVKPLTTPTPSFCAARAVFLHFFGGPGVDAGRIAVAPDVRRQDGLVPRVDLVQHGLADQVGADGVQLQVVALQQVASAGAIAVVGQRLVDLEMVAPAGQLEAVVAELAGFAARSSSGRSAHWPVNSVTGLVMRWSPAWLHCRRGSDERHPQ